MSYFGSESARFARCLEELRGRKVAVIGHVRPDGDCMGSQVGMTRILRQMGIDAVAVNHDKLPTNIRAFVGDTPFLGGEPFDPTGYEAIKVDCADGTRVGPELAQAFPQAFLNIDHHVSNDDHGRNNFVFSKAAATGEILAGLFFDLGYPVDAITAQALYVAIATDTGQFKYASTSPRVFDIARRLCEAGAEPAHAAYHLYENETFARRKLVQRFLDSLELHCGGRVCIGSLTPEDYASSGALPEDAEGLVEMTRSLQGVQIGAFIEYRQGFAKASLRAKDGQYEVQRIAQQFGGGGHTAAAGLSVEGDTSKLKEALLAAITARIQEVDATIHPGSDS